MLLALLHTFLQTYRFETDFWCMRGNLHATPSLHTQNFENSVSTSQGDSGFRQTTSDYKPNKGGPSGHVFI
jgi:hypothetical protein